MICDKCESEMEMRNGKFGGFFFCPNSGQCGKKTVTAIDRSNVDSFFRTQAIHEYQAKKSKMSKNDRDALFYAEGEQMMENIEFGELGGM